MYAKSFPYVAPYKTKDERLEEIRLRRNSVTRLKSNLLKTHISEEVKDKTRETIVNLEQEVNRLIYGES